jgi:HAD superfamily hydrolase (TIGR01509 family)
VARCSRYVTGEISIPSAGSARCCDSELSGFDLVIFDCDGVLVDSERLNVEIEAELLTELGWPLTPKDVAELFLGRTDEYMRKVIMERLPDLPADWEDRFDARYLEAHVELQPVDGIVEALDEIPLATCVASSGTHEKMRRTLAATGLYERFEGRIFSATEVEQGKPEPDLFLYAAERMGAEPATCAVVEDSPFGVQAARAAGMTAFAYAGGVTPAERLQDADVVFDEMRELPRLLGH